jgi:site-specific DNA recombinase
VTTEESVSIARQLESAHKFCEARGWEVMEEYVDDGVSASKVKPEQRAGWQALLHSSARFDAVVVWKIDRLARRVLDFLHANEALAARSAAIVAVEDPVDMTTPQGRAFATMLAVFGEMEAEAIASRVRASRGALVRSGRRPGGRPPFGWKNVPNPDGPGLVLAQDPERVGVVIKLAEMGLAGKSLYSMVKWLEAEDIKPRPRRPPGAGPAAEPVEAFWHDASVEAILRAPALAGLTPYDGDVLRDDNGLPVIDESVAILTTEERRRLQARLEEGKRPGSRQKAGLEPALLYGLIRCGTCDGLMHRATTAVKYQGYRCQQKGCSKPVGVVRQSVEDLVVDQVMFAAGDKPVITAAEVHSGDNAALLADTEAAIRETTAAMALDESDMDVLSRRLTRLKEMRADARAGVERTPEFRVSAQTLTERWVRTSGVEERRQLLIGQLEAVRIGVGGGRGRAFDATRVSLHWRQLDPAEQERRKSMEHLLFMRAWPRDV